MSTPVQLSLPMSATALRLGAAFLTQLADQTETIYDELTGLNPFAPRNANSNGGEAEETLDNVGQVPHPVDPNAKIIAHGSASAADMYRADELEAERLRRLHGNIASAGGDHTDPLNAAQVFGGDAPKPAGAVAPQPPAPVAPVAPTAPAPTPPAAANPNGAIATDKAGLPWDRRIHSESKSINKTDGLWRAKRGRDESIVPGIEAELRAAMEIPTPVAPDTPKPDPVPSATAPAAPVAPPAPTAPVAPPALEQASTGPKSLGELMAWAQAEIAAGRLASLDEVRKAAVEVGVAGLPLLGTRPDLIPTVYALLGGVAK